MLEVLVSIVILVFGLLGLAALQSKIQLAETESYQRAQAILLLGDMVDRMNNNKPTADSYVTAAPVGTGDGQPANCTQPMGVARDLCEWSNALKGASEQKAATNAGAMIGARGCIEQRQIPIPTPGICQPGIYRVTVTWQGLNPTTAPALTCAQGLYGDARLQRAISAPVIVSLLGC